MDILIEKLLDKTYRNVVILSGAGVSTNAGISDYRSKTGIFSKLATEFPEVDEPSDLFSQRMYPLVKDHPSFKDFREQMLKAHPTFSHHLARVLHERGQLKRVITQNVDGLYQKTGLPESKIIEYHGSYLKDNVVLYGGEISYLVQAQVREDFVNETDTDLLVVMGTSLQVAPFCAIPNLVPKSCTRVLVDVNPGNAMTNSWTKVKSREGMSFPFRSFIKIGKRKVTLRPLWMDHKRYPDQYIFEQDVDEWSQEIINALT